mgnify:CR=1 FL=1
MGYLTSKDLSKPEPITGAASVQMLREAERDKVHAERELLKEVSNQLKEENKKNKKVKSGKSNTHS